MTKGETNGIESAGDRDVGGWIGDVSAERVNCVWRPEDHKALLRNLREADRLATQVVDLSAERTAHQIRQSLQERTTMASNLRLSGRGLNLPSGTLKRLRENGVFVRTEVTLEYQSGAKRYVLRGIESGGAVAELGRYVSFCGTNGERLAWLQPIDSLQANGIHAVVVASGLTRIEMFRTGRTYELSITRHRFSEVPPGRRPSLLVEEVFHGENGFLALELRGKDKSLSGSVLPEFVTRSGEKLVVPLAFERATQAVTGAVNCVGCRDCHYLIAPMEGDPGDEDKERRATIVTPAPDGSASDMQRHQIP